MSVVHQLWFVEVRYADIRRLRQAAAATVARHPTVREPVGCPVAIEAEFRVSRQRSHFAGGSNLENLRPDAPARPVGNPQLRWYVDRLLDALVGTVIVDAHQVVELDAEKRYGTPYVRCLIRQVPDLVGGHVTPVQPEGEP